MVLDSFGDGGTAAIIGATGGIGAALVKQVEACGQFQRVMGFCRTGELPLDVTDEASIANAAIRLSTGPPLRLVIVATGALAIAGHGPEKTWRQIDPTHMAQAFAINAIGPALLMKHLLPLLPRDGKAVFAALSARVGSIGDNRLGGWYSYRAAKAALNQLVRTSAVELARQRPQAICLAIHPGTVDTRLSAPHGKTGLDVRSPEVAAAEILAVIDAATTPQNGAFLDHKGQIVPW